MGSGINIKKAIRKYGRENFKVELLEWCETQDLSDELEKYYIKYYNSQDAQIGYNITNGGQTNFFTGLKHSEESKRTMSEKAKCRPHSPATSGRICYTNGRDNKMLFENQIEEYENLGWVKGKTCNLVPWNKGLTKETDEIVARYTETRNKHFENGESIGCYGLKGNTNGFKKGNTPWNKGLKGYNKGHPNYHLGKSCK